MATSQLNLSTKLNAIFNLTNVLLAAVFIMTHTIYRFEYNGREFTIDNIIYKYKGQSWTGRYIYEASDVS